MPGPSSIHSPHPAQRSGSGGAPCRQMPDTFRFRPHAAHGFDPRQAARRHTGIRQFIQARQACQLSPTGPRSPRPASRSAAARSSPPRLQLWRRARRMRPADPREVIDRDGGIRACPVVDRFDQQAEISARCSTGHAVSPSACPSGLDPQLAIVEPPSRTPRRGSRPSGSQRRHGSYSSITMFAVSGRDPSAPVQRLIGDPFGGCSRW